MNTAAADTAGGRLAARTMVRAGSAADGGGVAAVGVDPHQRVDRVGGEQRGGGVGLGFVVQGVAEGDPQGITRQPTAGTDGGLAPSSPPSGSRAARVVVLSARPGVGECADHGFDGRTPGSRGEDQGAVSGFAQTHGERIEARQRMPPGRRSARRMAGEAGLQCAQNFGDPVRAQARCSSGV